jgi:uncharacterized membrane protein YfcA
MKPALPLKALTRERTISERLELLVRFLSKNVGDGITQPYILVMQLISLSILALTRHAIFNMEFWSIWALTLPAVLLGTSTGVGLYRRMSEMNFRRAVLILLMVSGVSLVVKALI